MNFNDKRCRRCGGTAKGGVIICKSGQEKGEGVYLCSKCLEVVEAATKDDSPSLIEVEWKQ